MNILIIGSGGREHAMVWKASQSPLTEKIFVAPGNAGTAEEPKTTNIDISVTDISTLLDFALNNNIALTIVGPEAPLAKGIVNTFQEAGLLCLGPTKEAALLESSKAYCKDFLAKHQIPTAQYQHFTDPQKAKDYVRAHETPIVIKADGLAAGKGVVIAQTEAEAFQAIDDCLKEQAFGNAGQTIVIEEFLVGDEASFIVLCDGEHTLPLATSQDHKARDNNDKGPNTGGMGAYSPAPVLTASLQKMAMDSIILPTLQGLRKQGIRYTGFLYAGLMITKEGLKVLEFNCRLGDPETQPLLMRIDSDFVDLCLKAAEGQLDRASLSWKTEYALGVVLAAKGYPNSYQKGDIIQGLEGTESLNTKVFHAGTTKSDDHIVTNGGRILCVTALGNSVAIAQKRAYDIAKKINWDGCYFRTDIGYKAIQLEQQEILHAN